MNGTRGLQKAPDPGSVFDELRGSQTHVQAALIQAEWGEHQRGGPRTMTEGSGRIHRRGSICLGLEDSENWRGGE